MKRLRVVEMDRCIGCYSCILACARHRYDSFSLEKAAIDVKIRGETEGSYKVVKCRFCFDAPCARVCEPKALKEMRAGGVRLYPDKCTGCALCVEACIVGAVKMDQETRKPIICNSCGACVPFCPHGVLSMEFVEAL